MTTSHSRPVPLVIFPTPHSKPLPDVQYPPPSPPRKPWTSYLGVLVIIFFLILPHPILLYLHLRLHYNPKSTSYFNLPIPLNLILLYLITFAASSSLIVCLVRDPGPVPLVEVEDEEDGGMSLSEALLGAGPKEHEGRWCDECMVPKPARTHHCSQCSRCVLKMDHHCPWIASRCVGHRTHPPFLHFLLTSTLLALFTFLSTFPSIKILFAFQLPNDDDVKLLFLALFLPLVAFVMTLAIGSFLGYHIFLISKNRTSLEALHPSAVLPHLPPPHNSLKYDELSKSQRQFLKYGRKVWIWDLGFKRNWRVMNGGVRWWEVVWWGGRPRGDGLSFRMRDGVEKELEGFAARLVNARDDHAAPFGY